MSKLQKIFYWISTFTWGIIGTIAGFFTWLFFLTLGCCTDRWKGSFRTNVRNHTNNGCFSIGCFTFIDTPTPMISNHEFGHCIQNAIWGPLVFFVVYIPSAINYWKCCKTGDWSSHDNMWCERNATELGSKPW